NTGSAASSRSSSRRGSMVTLDENGVAREITVIQMTTIQNRSPPLLRATSNSPASPASDDSTASAVGPAHNIISEEHKSPSSARANGHNISSRRAGGGGLPVLSI